MNDAPVASPDSKATAHETSVLIDVLANDADVDGDSLTISAVGTPSVGAAAIESGRVRFSPPAAFSGAATFSYTASDGTATDSAIVTVTVAPEPTPAPTPTAAPTPTPLVSPLPTPNPTPAPRPAPHSPAAEPSPADPLQPEPSPSPTATPEPDAPSSSPPRATESPSAAPAAPSVGEDNTLQPLAAPQVTTSFGSSEGLFEFAGLFGGFGGSFAWAMPAAMLGVPGLLFMLAVAGQLLGAAVWVPAIRRMLAGVGIKRRRRG